MAPEDQAPAQRVAIPGSEREEPTDPRIGDVDPTSEIEVTAYLRPSASLDWVDEEAAKPPAERHTLSREELARQYGASQEDVDAVRAFAGEYGLEVRDAHLGRRSVVLRGTLDALTQAFGAEVLGSYRHSTAGTYSGRRGTLTIPAELDGVITGVFGIDNRPQARTHLRIQADAAAATSYTPVQVAEAYGFPSALDGTGETVGIIELGGGFSQTDLDTYFEGLGLTAPTPTAVPMSTPR
jgi:kumamolisin